MDKEKKAKKTRLFLSLSLYPFFSVFLLCQRFTREASSCRCAAQWRPERLANEKENGQIFFGKCRLQRSHHRPSSSNNQQSNVPVVASVHFGKKSNYEHRLFWGFESKQHGAISWRLGDVASAFFNFRVGNRWKNGHHAIFEDNFSVSPYSSDIPLSTWWTSRLASQTPTTYFRWKFHVRTGRTAHLPLTPPWLPNTHCRTDPQSRGSTLHYSATLTSYDGNAHYTTLFEYSLTLSYIVEC